ncbi:hypothetical protein KSD_73810 [Ktedonobacter sp. SOSP1-85]|uniref:ester cyclase n=1 Tax=Ktedonobacter sp. SOSP1-85 TaxID=2778367 RepID=UPI00191608B5|nr:ester cyclase [Ktedonobacter sp. SOSP1-85]GHO79610.1 hypothetical protein KSD_73810 [Ktedonobacter sp. SOSP1-85]
MSVEENKVLVCRVAEAIWNRGNLAYVDETYRSDYLHHDPNLPAVRTRENFKRWVAASRNAFPDFHITHEDLIAEHDRVMCRVILQGTHAGSFGLLTPIPATGKPITVAGVVIFRVAEGKIVEDWYQIDNLRIMQQLGQLPRVG